MNDSRDTPDPVSVAAKLKKLLPSDFARLERSERNRAVTLASLQFESFVVDLLRSSLRANSSSNFREVIQANGGRFDFISPISFNDLPPPIAFDVRFFATSASIKNELLQLVNFYEPDERFGTFVVVTNHDPSPADRNAVTRANDKVSKVKLAWWGPSQLQDLVTKLGEKGAEIVQSLPVAGIGAALRGITQGRSDDWKAARPGIISDLTYAWRNDELVFFLGAGISIDAGVPQWKKLLSTLYSQLVEHIAPTVVQKSPVGNLAKAVKTLMDLQDGSPLLNARSIRSGLPLDFNEAVRGALYANIDIHAAKQLQTLARLCDPPRGRVGAKAVVTYNFDDLLEQVLSSLHINHLSVCTGDSRPRWTQLPIYHVHGLIPQKGAIPADQTLVFSEEGYHTAYNNPYTWSNVVQLNLMTQHTCLFVGLSMTDPNLRRLLEIANAAKSGPRHVALLRRTSEITGSGLMGCESKDQVCAVKLAQAVSKEVEESVLAIHHTAWEMTLKELGVRVLWFERYEEIPQILESIRFE